MEPDGLFAVRVSSGHSRPLIKFSRLAMPSTSWPFRVSASTTKNLFFLPVGIPTASGRNLQKSRWTCFGLLVAPHRAPLENSADLWDFLTWGSEIFAGKTANPCFSAYATAARRTFLRVVLSAMVVLPVSGGAIRWPMAPGRWRWRWWPAWSGWLKQPWHFGRWGAG